MMLNGQSTPVRIGALARCQHGWWDHYYYRARFFHGELGGFVCSDSVGKPYDSGRNSIRSLLCRRRPRCRIRRHPVEPHPVSITSRRPPRITQCGEFKWEVELDVPGVSRGSAEDSAAGYIVQKIQYRADVFNCDGSRKVPPIRVCYFEAFGPLSELPEVDLFSENDRGEGTYGSYSVEGELRWLPALDVEEESIPNGKWLPPMHAEHPIEAGTLYAHPCTSNPNGWDNAGPSLRHAVSGSWNCCCGGRRPPTVGTVPPSGQPVLVPVKPSLPPPVIDIPPLEIDEGLPSGY
jgi:hypothetical protein